MEIKKINAAESLRGLACLIVFFSHISLVFFPQLFGEIDNKIQKLKFAEYVFNSPFSFFYSGNGAVYIFFILSGYVLTVSSFKTKNSLLKLKQSLVKRVPRLMIPAICSCILMLVVVHANIDLTNVNSWFYGFPIFNAEKKSIIGAIYSGSIEAFIFGHSSYNEILWTMRIELVGSILIFLICFFKNKSWKIFCSLIFIFITFYFEPKSSVVGIVGFLVGHLIYFCNFRLNNFVAIFLVIVGLWLLGSKPSSLSYSFILDNFGDFKLKISGVLIFIGAIFVVFSSLKSKLINSLLDVSWLTYLGKLSFSIYLTHIAIIYIVGIPVFNLFFRNGFDYIFSAFFSLFFVLISTIIFSRFFYYIDANSIMISKKIQILLVR